MKYLCVETRTPSGYVDDSYDETNNLDDVQALLSALGDDVSRPAAEAALRQVGAKVKPVLLRAALESGDGGEQELYEHQRRLSVLRILSEMPLTREDWEQMRPLLYHQDRTISITTALIGVRISLPIEKQIAARLLIESFEQADRSFQAQIERCLRQNYVSVRDVIAEAVLRRSGLMREVVLSNPVLPVLIRLQSDEEEASEDLVHRPGKAISNEE